MKIKQLGGWMRLWVVLTCTWGIIISIQLFQHWPNPGDIHDTELIPRLTTESLELITASKTSGPLQVALFAEAKDELLSGQKTTKSLVRVWIENASEAQVDALRADYVAALRGLVWEKGRREVYWAFLAWALPCFFLMVTGIAIRWVYRGFRPRG